jgi:hypothetical protein
VGCRHRCDTGRTPSGLQACPALGSSPDTASNPACMCVCGGGGASLNHIIRHRVSDARSDGINRQAGCHNGRKQWAQKVTDMLEWGVVQTLVWLFDHPFKPADLPLL